MWVEKIPQSGLKASPPHAPRILSGLWRQREELGAIADELIELFRRHGMASGEGGAGTTRHVAAPGKASGAD